MITFVVQKFSCQNLDFKDCDQFNGKSKDVNFWEYFPHFLYKMMVSKGFHENTVYFTIGFPIVMEVSPEIDI